MKDANGLQINNLVVADTYIEKDVVFSIQSIMSNGITTNGSPFRIFDIEDICPLDIAPETLGLFVGWQHITAGCIRLQIGDLFLRYSPIYAAVQVWIHGGIIASPKYIHELQNIVSSLTGQYLQLKNQEL